MKHIPAKAGRLNGYAFFASTNAMTVNNRNCNKNQRFAGVHSEELKVLSFSHAIYHMLFPVSVEGDTRHAITQHFSVNSFSC